MTGELKPRYYPWTHVILLQYVILLWYYASAYAQWIHEEVHTVLLNKRRLIFRGRLFFL
jgi:hypothetical protein